MTQAAETEVVNQEAEAEELETEATEAGEESSAEETEGEGTEAEADEVVITLGEDPPPSDDENRAPGWVRELRKANREKDRRIRELEAKLSTTTAAEQAADVGEEPTLEACEYDESKFKAAWRDWNQRKQDQETKEAERRRKAEAEQAAWQATLDAYGKEKSSLKVADFEDAEHVVQEALSTTQQGVILHGVEAGKRASLVYALGKNPAKLKELAAIADPVKFAFAVADLRSQLKVTPKKVAPVPERTVRGSAPGAAAVDNQLERLRAEADKTGDRTKVVRYMAERRRQS